MKTLLALGSLVLASSVLAQSSQTAQKDVQRHVVVLQKRLAKLDGDAARVRVLLSRARDTRSPVTLAVERLLSREPTEKLAKVAQKSGSARDRRTALAAMLLAGRPHSEVLAIGVRDRSSKTLPHLVARMRSANVTGQAGDELGRYLKSGNRALRLRAARAMLGLGSPEANRLVRSAARAGKFKSGSRRGHAAFLQQTAYIKRYSAEVA